MNIAVETKENHQKRSRLPTCSSPCHVKDSDKSQKCNSLDNSFKVVRDKERNPKVRIESLFERLLSQGSSTKLNGKLTPHFKDQHKQFFPEYQNSNGNTDNSHTQGIKIT